MKHVRELLAALRVLVRYRDRILEGVMLDVKQRYVGSVLGSAWAILFPALQLGIYAALYGFIFRVRPSGLTEVGYIILIFSGLVPLLAFNESLSAATSSLASNRGLLLNTVFPAELIPVRAAIAGQVTSLVALGFTLLAAISTGHANLTTIVLVPVFWVMLLLFSIGVGWMLSLLSLVATDVQHGLGIVTMLLFVLSPFAYTPEMVPNALRPLIFLNPLSYFVLAFQSSICYGQIPPLTILAVTAILGLGMFCFGFIVFRKAKNVFFDYA